MLLQIFGEVVAVPVQILRSSSGRSGAEGIGTEGSGADIGVRFRKVPVQMLKSGS